MANMRKMGENRIIEQQRSIKRRKKLGINSDIFFFISSEENKIIKQQGTVNNRTFVLLNFHSIIPAPTIYIYYVLIIFFNYFIFYLILIKYKNPYIDYIKLNKYFYLNNIII